MPIHNITVLTGSTTQINRGAILLSFDELVNDYGIDYVELYVNDVTNPRVIRYTDIQNLYSTYIYSGDVVTIKVYSDPSNLLKTIQVLRRNYTTDDRGGDNGIYDSFISDTATTSNPLSVTFTASTTSDSYNFEYIVAGYAGVTPSPTPTPPTPTPTPTPTVTPTPTPTPTATPAFTCFEIGTGFAPSGSTYYVTEIVTDSSSNVYIGGNYTGYNGTNVTNLIKLDQWGQKETSFATTTDMDGIVDALALQADGKLLVGGFFTTYSGVSKNRIVRLNSNGTIDNSYSIGSGFSGGGVYQIKLKSNGQAIVVGEFTGYNGSSTNRIAQLTTAGGLVYDFGGTTGGTDGNIWGVDVDSLNRIVIVGNFTTYRGVARRDICRINADTTIDNTFNPGSGFTGDSSNYVVKVQSDDKIIVGGTFSNYSGVSVNDLIRLNTDGSIDTSFNIGTGSNAWVEWFDILPDGKLLVVGPFSQWNGSTANKIVLLNTDGSTNTSFTSTGTGPNENVLFVKYDTLLGKPYFGGQFNSYNGLFASHILRTTMTGAEDLCPAPTPTPTPVTPTPTAVTPTPTAVTPTPTAATKSLEIFGRDIDGTPSTLTLFYSKNGGSNINVPGATSTTLPSSCSSIYTITGLNTGDSIEFGTSIACVMNGNGPSSTCPSSSGSATTYTYVMDAPSTQQVAITIDSGTIP
jgi:uncharacterized delta-60 repeat protein